ncbi:uncharacterized protein KY384_007137 [Bacidia gigantensis]|uniref:uncharacterized protein n=1 Tax=Bacidia gigantensis TaxID=2732470 RepID=UPI001D044EA8|nr:uncharacterized protein KY384_007137 [Bacidia gigantensis]KAG8528220.1 hypothetical protein KY384_007137 [Bacidia gigantensis]
MALSAILITAVGILLTYGLRKFRYFLVGPRAYHILDPVNLEAVLSTNFDDYGFGARHDVFAPLMGTGIFTQEGPAWKRSRELLRSQFARAQYRNLEPFREHVDNLIEQVSAAGPVLDLQPLFFKLTLDTTTDLLLGHSVYSLKAHQSADVNNVAFAKNFDAGQSGLAKRFRLAPWQSLYNPKHFRQACSSVHRFVEQYIEEQDLIKGDKSLLGDNESFVSQLAHDSSSNYALRDQLLNVLIAGRDTTACCLSWTIRLLVRHPTVLQRLRGEIDAVLNPDDHPTREQIRRMPYLSYIIKESLRLFPPVPLNNRTANRHTILPRGGGLDGKSPILVRKGELVVFSQYVNSRRKNIYGPDAELFRPERWEGLNAAENFGWAYFPFNGGPRACLGQDFAVMEASYTIIRLLQTFPKISLPRDEDSDEKIGTEKQRLTLVLSPANGCRVDIGHGRI